MKRQLDYLKILKIAIGAGLAIVLADHLGLQYSASAGVITLLSIQDTKKETLRVMVRRLLSFVIALVMSGVCFGLFGYGALSVVVFLLFFSAFCICFQMQEGISVNTVLMTHFLAERSMSAGNIKNELLLLLVGAGIGVIFNLYIPGKTKQIRRSQQQIEAQMRGIIGSMAQVLSGKKGEYELRASLDKLDQELTHGEKSAYEEMENTLLSETRYYLHYMNMRKMQTLALERIVKNMDRLGTLPSQAGLIAKVMEHISGSFQEYNNALALLEELELVKAAMRQQPLPAGREEFENRSVLFSILLELEQFLVLKREFVGSLSETEIERFWKKREL